MKRFLLILTFLASFFPKPAFAANAINKFGIHILEPSDLPKAQELVNSSGGDWGWVTIVIRDDDMNHDKWQAFMDDCRVRHLIPIIRIATHLEGSNWAKPKIDDSRNWANFLTDLNWPVSNQYVIIFNEPNHAKEWGGEVNPKEYARILKEYSSKFKNLPRAESRSSKFKILNSGFDSAAPNGKTTMEAYKFMEEMNKEVPGIFEKIDAWSSHSYPNHGFLGKPWESTKHSIKGYFYELSFLKNDLKLSKDLPVFITETGWPHDSSKFKVQSAKLKNSMKYYDGKAVAEYIKYAFENVWLKDDRVVAVTPFVLNYPEDLFDEFSWLDIEGNPYQQYSTVVAMQKQNWRPEQETKIEIKSLIFPPFMLVNSEYNSRIKLKNVGQSIWGEYTSEIAKSEFDNAILLSSLRLSDNVKVKPGEEITLDYSVKSSSSAGEFNVSWKDLSSHNVRVFPRSLISQTQFTFWQKIISKVEKIFGK